jgi:Protein of unknown function (DUF3159)
VTYPVGGSPGRPEVPAGRDRSDGPAGPAGPDVPVGPAGPDDARQSPVQVTLVEAIGGTRGIIDSSVPTIAFVIANSEAGLTPAIIIALVAATVIVAVRLIRREPVQQAFSGLLGVALAAFIASRMHRAEGYFLPSILRNCALTAIGLGSVLVRRPLAGYLMATFEPGYREWRTIPGLRRAALWATWIWIAVFAVRGGIQTLLYLQGRAGWLAVANIALGLPLFGLAVLATYAVIRRCAPEHAPPSRRAALR